MDPSPKSYIPCRIPWVHRGLLSLLTGRTQFLSKYGELDKIVSNFVVRQNPLDAKSTIVDSLFEINEGNISINIRKHVLIMMPRGFAKTSIAGLAIPAYKILYREVPFFVYVSHAGAHAKMQIDNLKRILSTQEEVRDVFGDLRPKIRDDETWNKDFFETTTGMAMAARGKGGQVRGLNHKGQRPHEIIFDDLEDYESAKSDTQREATITWAYADLFQALPKLVAASKIIGLGTLLHKRDILATVANDPQWSVVNFGARDLQGDLLWPENMDEDKIEAERQSFAAAGRLANFYLEYFNTIRASEAQIFHVDRIIYEDVPPDLLTQTAIYCDPAFSKSRTADYAAVAVVSICMDGRLYVRDCWMKRGATNIEITNVFFGFHKHYNCRAAGIENIAGQAALESYFREQMFRRGTYFELEGVANKSNKIQRIVGILSARYASSHLRHCRKFPLLETQLDDFRQDDSHEHDDGPDAVAGAIALLDPHAAMAAGRDLGESAFPEPRKEWRQH